MRWSANPAAAERGPRSGEAAHVVYSSNADMVPGVVASIRSVLAHASGPVTFHYMGDSPLPRIDPPARDATATDLDLDVDVRFVSLKEITDRYLLGDFYNEGLRRDGQEAINKMAANYARFAIDAVLSDKRKALYLDADTIVTCDVVDLLRGILNGPDDEGGPVVAAVPRGRGIYGLTAKGEGLYGGTGPSFNAGVYAMNLDRWRAQNTTGAARDVALRNVKEHLYFYGSQPPLNIAVGDGFEHLPSGWNVKAAKAGRFERKHDGERLCLTHYTGQDKPWNGKGYQIKEWKKYGKAVRAAKEGRFR